MKSPAASRFACSPLVLLLSVGVSISLPAEVAAQASEPFADGAANRPPTGQPYQASVNDPEPSPAAWGGIAVGGGAIGVAGLGLAAYGTGAFILFGGPIDSESQKRLHTCCAEQGFLAPAYLAIAGGGLLLGYSAARSRNEDGESRYADSTIQDNRNGLIIGGAFLGTATALYLLSAILNAAAYSAVVRDSYGYYSYTPTGERLPYAVLGTMIPAMLLAFPGGVTTGIYLSRYLQDRKRPGRSTGAARGNASLMLAPMLSRELYGLQASGRF